MREKPNFQESINQSINQSIRKQLAGELNRLKTNYKDGIPSEVKHSTSEDSGWKVQKAWFTNVDLKLCDILHKYTCKEIIISEKLFKEILSYHNNLTRRDNPFRQRLTTQEDINEAEAMIDKVLAELEK